MVIRKRPKVADMLSYGGRKARRQVDQAHNASPSSNMRDRMQSPPAYGSVGTGYNGPQGYSPMSTAQVDARLSQMDKDWGMKDGYAKPYDIFGR